MERVYLDHNATTPLDPRVLEAMRPWLEGRFGNASSLHWFGQRARAAVEDARAQVASVVGASPAEIVFTSGGTEADNLALRGVAAAAESRRRKVLVSAVEHPAVLNTAKVPAGATVAVFGCGGIGLSAVNGAAIAGADRVIAIDMISSKLDVAKLMGATDVINASNVDPVEAIKEMTGGGVEYSFEAVGLKTTAEQSFQCLRPGGTATIIGMVPFGMKIELHGYDFLRERKIQGSSMGSNRFRFDMPKLLNAWKRGELKLDHLISSHIKLEEINEGYVKLKGGVVLRQLIDFGVAK